MNVTGMQRTCEVAFLKKALDVATTKRLESFAQAKVGHGALQDIWRRGKEAFCISNIDRFPTPKVPVTFSKQIGELKNHDFVCQKL